MSASAGPVYAPAALRQAGIADTTAGRAEEGYGDPSCVCFAPNGRVVATRGGAGDDTVRLWDVRMLRTQRPITTIANVRTLHDNSNLCFSAASRYVVSNQMQCMRWLESSPVTRYTGTPLLRYTGTPVHC